MKTAFRRPAKAGVWQDVIGLQARYRDMTVFGRWPPPGGIRKERSAATALFRGEWSEIVGSLLHFIGDHRIRHRNIGAFRLYQFSTDEFPYNLVGHP
ncbi:hypothetical protein [Serratia sp. JKS296]|uniref:hypothetical protein n=1 Tax=Serratia sp. JKS296 TaxID=1938824 RepID=UPI001141955C|nr:hypothetical protein [Serratia sp. JKS296]